MRYISSSLSRRLLMLALGMLVGVGAARAGGGPDDDHHGNMLRAVAPAAVESADTPSAVPGGPGYLMLAASDFKTDSDQDTFFRYWGGNFIEPAEGASGIGISAAVHLPQGAHIIKITASYADSDPNSAPLFDLYRGITGTLQLVG